MLELRTFGGLSITVDGAVANGAAIQRKTLALLALLAATKHGISRDKLVAYLWPESDTAHGRNLLRQACYALRRDLDAPELVLGSTELRLNPDVVNSDVRQFQDALDRGDHAAAVALYQGPFLDGFFLSETEEFERWVEGERTRLAYEVSSALQLLAREAGDAGRFQAEAEHWRQLTQIDPFSARAAIGMMQALDQAGERVAAVFDGVVILAPFHAAALHIRILETGKTVIREFPSRVADFFFVIVQLEPPPAGDIVAAFEILRPCFSAKN